MRETAAETAFLGEGGDWKERFCVLKGSKLFMYRKEADYTANGGGESSNHTQAIDLLGGDTEIEPYEVYDRHAFRVEARNYQKDGKDVADSRPFIFSSALDPEKHQMEQLKRDVDDWHYFFKFAIEHTNMKALQDPLAEAKKAAKEARLKKAAEDEAENGGGLRKSSSNSSSSSSSSSSLGVTRVTALAVAKLSQGLKNKSGGGGIQRLISNFR